MRILFKELVSVLRYIVAWIILMGAVLAVVSILYPS